MSAPTRGPVAVDATTLRRRLPWPVAVEALRSALLAGRAPGRSPLRSSFATSHGEVLLMPAEAGDFAGVKLASVNDGSAGSAVPRVQGVYVLFDAATLSPLATLDGVTLTAIRTAAVSALAVDALAGPSASRLVVFGSGPQARHHVAALGSVRRLAQVRVVGRDPDRTAALVRALAEAGVDATAGQAGDVAGADLVACCTTAETPLFDSRSLPDEATVVAVGSHHRERREVDAALVERATTVVESRESAFAEAGDVVAAVAEGVDAGRAVDGDLSALVAGTLRPTPGRPRLFKSVGEAWEDLVLASAAFRAGTNGQPSRSM